MNYDVDQQAVIDCQDQFIVAEAFAGSGKTTMTIGFANKRPNKRIIYLCFGKANQMDARKRFPKWVECRTSHAVAFKEIGRLYGDRVIANWKSRHVAEDLGINIQKASVVHAVLNNFLSSTRTEISKISVSDISKSFDMPSSRVDEVHALASMLWKRMNDIKDTVKLTHDVYLKIWALSNPVLNYDVVILDEAQDTNPITAMVVLAQKHATILMVGDRHQSIYAYRGASNAMEKFAEAGATVLKMPRTWRYGPRTAALATALLKAYKNETSTIIGMGCDEEYVPGAPVAFIARTNAQLFAMAAQRRGEGVFWIGGAKNYRLDLVLDAYHLSVGNKTKIRDPLLNRYATWAEYVDEAKRSKDVESKIIIDAVSTYGDGIPVLIDDIYFNEITDETKAERFLTTAHKSKGFGWDYVKLCEDFKTHALINDSLKKFNKLTADVKQEVNLLYVAITRAKRKVFLDEDSKLLFNDLREKAAK